MGRAKLLDRLYQLTTMVDGKCVEDHIALLDAAQGWYGFVCGTARAVTCLSREYVGLVRKKLRAGVGVKFVFRGASFLRAKALAKKNHFAELLRERDADPMAYHSLRVHVLPKHQGPSRHFAFSDEEFGLMETFHREGDRKRRYVIFRDRLAVMALQRRLMMHMHTRGSKEVLTASEYEAIPNYAPKDEHVPKNRRADLARRPLEYVDTALYGVMAATQEQVFADCDRRSRDPFFADDPFTSVWDSARPHLRKVQEEESPATRFCVLLPRSEGTAGNSLVKLWVKNAAAARAGALVSCARA